MIIKGLRNVSNVSFSAQSLVSYKFLSLYPETRIVLTFIKKMSLQQRPLRKIITNQNVELGSPVLIDLYTTQLLYLRLSQGSLQKRGRKPCKMQRNREFAVRLCLQEMSEPHVHSLINTAAKHA